MALHAQPEVMIKEDLTSKLQNVDFAADEPVGATIRTYDYDMPDKMGLGNGGTDLFGQQAGIRDDIVTVAQNLCDTLLLFIGESLLQKELRRRILPEVRPIGTHEENRQVPWQGNV